MLNLNFLSYNLYYPRFATLLTFVTEMASQPPSINRTGIPGFLEQYTQIDPDTIERVTYVFYLYKTHNSHYVPNTHLEKLVEFIEWCNSSMVSNEKYTDNAIRVFMTDKYYGSHINLEPVLRKGRTLYTNNAVNIKKFRKCVSVLSNFRLDVYKSVFSDILEFENYEKNRYKKELFDAAHCGNSDEVRRIFDNRHPSIDNSVIYDAIKVSIRNGYNDVTKILVGYLPSYMRSYGMWFGLAMEHNNIDCVSWLVMTQCIEINSISTLRRIGAYAAWTPLYYAIDRNYRSMIEALINLRADINSGIYKCTLSFERFEHMKSPLYAVSESGNSDMVELLITSNASVDATDESLKTPLHAATQAGHIEIVKKLLDAKSDFNAFAMGPSPNTPFQIARANNNEEILMLFR